MLAKCVPINLDSLEEYTIFMHVPKMKNFGLAFMLVAAKTRRLFVGILSFSLVSRPAFWPFGLQIPVDDFICLI